jgi:hypothetical protein
MVLELSNKSVTCLSSLVTSLVLHFSVNHWHVLKVGDIIVLNNEHGAADLYNIVYFQWVQCADFALCRKPQPGSVGTADILKIESLSFSLFS